MHPNLQKLVNAGQKKSRLCIGLMSGTSLDGLDIALVEVSSSGQHTSVSLQAFVTIPYENDYLDIIRPLFANATACLEDVCEANVIVAKIHARMVKQALAQWQIQASDIDVLASHGQTIYHKPTGNSPSTLQIGDGDHLAQLTQINTLSDFRQKHIAAGGEGAPLVPYADYLLFTSAIEKRALLNVGGISNFTFLPINADFDSVVSADTGPGNTLMDAVVKHFDLNELGYDQQGAIAEQGKVFTPLLNILLQDPFFNLEQSISTGPEYFNLAWLEDKLALAKTNDTPLSHADILATLNRFTAASIAHKLKQHISPIDTHVYVSGGGALNATLMQNLQKELKQCTVKSADLLGIPVNAKEAVLFAVLANETLYGDYHIFSNSKGLPSVSLGKISLVN